MPLWVSSLADALGILSFIASAVIWYKTDRIRDEIRRQTYVYKTFQQDIIGQFIGFRRSIIEDKLTDLYFRSELRVLLLACRINYKNLLSIRDKSTIRQILRIIKTGDNIDSERLSRLTDTIIARFMKQED